MSSINLNSVEAVEIIASAKYRDVLLNMCDEFSNLRAGIKRQVCALDIKNFVENYPQHLLDEDFNWRVADAAWTRFQRAVVFANRMADLI